MYLRTDSSRAKCAVGFIAALALSACHSGKSLVSPVPFPTDPSSSQRDLLQRFHLVYPPVIVPRTAGVLAPRFGLPSFASTAATFDIELLAREPQAALRAALVLPSLDQKAAQDCLGAADSGRCIPLVLDRITPQPIEGSSFVHLVASASAAAVPVGAWDLMVQTGAEPPERLHRSVWIEDRDPTVAAPLRVVHLSDIHLGKYPTHTDGLVQALQRTIQQVNAAQPDLVVLTGDVVEDGQQDAWMERAHAQLLGIAAPLVVIPGNHDYSHFPKVLSADTPPDGWWNFAREFHSRRRVEFTFHGWDFLGFDSGPSVFSVRVLTRGVNKQTLEWLVDRVDRAARQGRKGVVLFSHAPTRTAPIGAPDIEEKGMCGQMVTGGSAIERIIEAGVEKKLNMVHLTGHTHWLELHELRPKADPHEDHFWKWPDGQVCGTAQSGALLLNIPAATRVTFHTIARGLRSGFGVLKLDGEKPVIETWLYDKTGKGGPCQGPRSR